MTEEGSWWINDLSLANVGNCLGVFEICLTLLLPNQPCSSSCERSEDLAFKKTCAGFQMSAIIATSLFSITTAN
jgi:hypothetical protein